MKVTVCCVGVEEVPKDLPELLNVLKNLHVKTYSVEEVSGIVVAFIGVVLLLLWWWWFGFLFVVVCCCYIDDVTVVA